MKEFDSLEGRTAFVTGGTSALGLGIARALLDKGARVFLADLSREKLAASASTLAEQGFGDRVGWAELDLLRLGDAEEAFEKAIFATTKESDGGLRRDLFHRKDHGHR